MFTFIINKLNFNTESSISLEPKSVTFIIGPNNSGKSQALKDIYRLISIEQGDGYCKVIKNLDKLVSGSFEDFKKWADGHIRHSTGNDYTYTSFNVRDSRGFKNLREVYERLQDYRDILCHRLSTEDRLEITKEKAAIPFRGEPREYIHVLQKDERKLVNISNDLKKCFGEELIINWGNGSSLWFHLGKEPEKTIYKDRISSEYLMELEKLPRLSDSGDGIRSFVGCLLAVYCGSHPILLIDEPEAFLHPPQARRLGAILAKQAQENERQFIIATHSSDIIRGAMSTNCKVAVCRIERKDNINLPYLLNSNELKELWSKPLLQSANTVNGIFHEGVIVCEADGDSRFYEAIENKLEEKEIFKKDGDLYFTHGGGKGEVSTLVKSYKSLHVKTAAIVDFDILQNKEEFKKLYEIFGGNFTEIESDYNIAKSGLDQLPSIKTTKQSILDLREIINIIEKDNTIKTSQKESISNILSESSLWSEAKKYGILRLRGTPSQKCKDLLNKCKNLGLFIILNGELESWWREGPSDKTQWVINTVEKYLNGDIKLEDAENFILEICVFLGMEKVRK